MGYEFYNYLFSLGAPKDYIGPPDLTSQLEPHELIMCMTNHIDVET